MRGREGESEIEKGGEGDKQTYKQADIEEW